MSANYTQADVENFMNHIVELSIPHVKNGLDPKDAIDLAIVEYRAFLVKLSRPEVRKAIVDNVISSVWHAVNDKP